MAKVFYTYENALMSAEGEDFYLQANPVLDFRLGYEVGSEQRIKLVNTRGVSLRFDLKKTRCLCLYRRKSTTHVRLCQPIQRSGTTRLYGR